MLSSLPVLDLSIADTDAGAEEFRSQLRSVTHEVGFFYLVGHGIDQSLIDGVLDVSRRFFELPDAAKLAIENVHSPQFRGYTRLGKELTNGDVDWREQIDIGEERDALERGSDTSDYWRLEGQNLRPAELPELETTIAQWRTVLNALSLRLLRLWAVALGAPEDVFDAAFADHPFSLIKIVRYPGETDTAPKQGVGAHRDGGVLTLLLVEPGKGGLQVEHEGEWIEAPSMRCLARSSLAPELRSETRGLSLDPTNSPILETDGENVLRYRLRAHPNVAELHHADLLNRWVASAPQHGAMSTSLRNSPGVRFGLSIAVATG